MTADELAEIRERADRLRSVPAGVPERDRDRLLAYVDELERNRARQTARYADAVSYGQNAASRFAHLRAVVTELSHHGDMTPTGKRVLMNVLDGVQ